MRPPTRLACGLLLVALLAGGCQRLNYETTVKLSGMDTHTINPDPPKYDQKVTVSVSSPGAPVSAYLVRTEDVKAALELLDRGKAPTATSVLGSQLKAEQIDFTVDVPKGLNFTVILKGEGKTTEAKVKITGR